MCAFNIYLFSFHKEKNIMLEYLDVITASYQKSKGFDSILEKILSKERSDSDEIIYLQNNEVNPQKYFPNESNITTKPKDNNGKLGHGQVFCIYIR